MTTIPTGPTGRIITLLGIDGSGKDTVAEALKRRLEGRDIEVEHLSRRDYLLTKPTGQTADLHRTMYDASLRAFYTKAVTAEGEDLADEMPSEGDLRDPLLERVLAFTEISANSAHTVLASAVSEIAGGIAYRETVLRQRAARTGGVLIEASSLLRSVLKNCMLVRHAAGEGTPLYHSATAVLDCAVTLLRPNSSRIIPVLVRCTPAIAYERRILQSGRLGPMEHYGPMGGDATRAAYLDLQHRVQHFLDRRIAEDWRCVVVDMDGPRDITVPAAVDAILADERMAGC
ncbi:hypothetical protein [Kitasatospora sp. GP82]|uniref:hypothetical protein n=1 Tax=Kitasatospora sp. GP82 TaxID=3035089 RepID=UPI002473694D|nr:hypothetical protein [Kitasatospora sp. GP82]MDH6130540.1 hypothetical protein [Kitasatospora sp. GP82]